jgi:hypothetical protein
MEQYLRLFREQGWRVAIHNDYMQTVRDSEENHRGGVVLMTFWLFTHSIRFIYAKGEGKTDIIALQECLKNAMTVDSKLKKAAQLLGLIK